MNVLFVNYGDFTTNSLNHIAGFANSLVARGFDCAVAVPWGRDTVGQLVRADFRAVSFEDIRQGCTTFRDGRMADLVHAWTPREVVRRFVIEYCDAARPVLIVHLEDNEEYLFSVQSGGTGPTTPEMIEAKVRCHLTESGIHPRRARLLLHASDAVTVITPALRAMVPASLPVLDLAPGVDFSQFRPLPPDPAEQVALGLRDTEKCIVYTGSTSFANVADIRELYEALILLNQRGRATRLIRTGTDDPPFADLLPTAAKPFVTHLGVVPKSRLPGLLALADVLVQPGHPGPFNDYRLPSKLPEFLASGRPVILPASNIGLDLRDGLEAIVLRSAVPAAIADACERIFADPGLARTLGENSAAFARRRFDLDAQVAGLANFYEQITAAPVRAGSVRTKPTGVTEISLGARRLAGRLGDAAATSEEAALARDLLPLIEHLEHPEAGGAAELVGAERERDRWRHEFDQARTHAQNLAATNAVLQQQVAAEQAQLEEVRQLLAVRDAEIAHLRTSFSWRVTRPLRALRRLFGGT